MGNQLPDREKGYLPVGSVGLKARGQFLRLHEGIQPVPGCLWFLGISRTRPDHLGIETISIGISPRTIGS